MKRKGAAFGVMAIVLLAATWVGSRLWAESTQNVYTSLEVFQRVLQITRDVYVRDVDLNQMIEDAMNGMLQKLDPYSMYMDPKEFENLDITMEGEFEGLGITIGIADDWLTVISPLQGSPAFGAGILAGDKIIEINGESTEGIAVDAAVAKLRGKAGTQVKITVVRTGVDEPLEFTIIRDTIKLNAVDYVSKLGPDIGYIKFSKFSKTAHTEITSALDSLFEEAGAKKIILDIRYNSGGYLNEGVDVSDLFLDRDLEVVQTRGRTPESIRTYRTHDDKLHGDYPLVVLTDYGSASAAEILAGALQDWERALIIGDTTFGKGSVQTMHPLSNGGVLKLTTAYWYTPAGRCIDKHRASLDTAKNEKPETFYTLGSRRRPLPSSGAIVPDVYSETERALELTSLLVNKRVFFFYGVDYLSKHPDIQPDFTVTDEMIQELMAEAEKRKVEFTQEEVDEARDQLAYRLKLDIASQKWGEQGWYEVLISDDPVVKKAMEVLSKAQTTSQLFSYAK